MLKRTTLDELSRVIEAEQSTGSNGATLVGLTLLTAVLGDAYLNAVGLSSFTGLLLSGLAADAPYRAIFVSALALQAAMLGAAMYALARSRWRASIRESLLAALPFVRRSKADTAPPDGPRTTRLSVSIVMLAVAGLLAWNLAASVRLFDLAGVLAGVLAVAVLATVATWVGLSILLVSRVDRYTLIGLAAGLLVCAVSFAYAPAHSLIFMGPEAAAAGASVEAPYITDFRYWQAAIVPAVLLIVITAAIESEWERRTIVLEHKGGAGPRYFTYSPVGMVFARPIYLAFHLPETSFIALSRREQDTEFTLIDTRDEHARTPLHDRSLRIWNISALSARVRTSFSQTDAGRYFRIEGTVGVLSVVTGFEQGERFDRAAVNLATDTLFRNDDIEGLLTRAVASTFEKLTADLRQTVDEVQREVDDIPYRMAFGTAATPLPNTADALLHAASDAQSKQKLATELLARINVQNGKFDQVRERLIAIGPAFLQPWKDAIAADLTTAAVAGEVPSALGKTTRIIDLIGLRLSEVRTAFAGHAEEVRNKLGKLRQEIEARYREAALRHQQALDERNRLLGTVATTVIASPHHSATIVAQAIGALSGSPEPRQSSHPPETPLLNGDNESASPT
jgi:hypothetical protein